MKVNRYEPDTSVASDGKQGTMITDPDGGFVRYEDYAALRDAVKEHRNAVLGSHAAWKTGKKLDELTADDTDDA